VVSYTIRDAANAESTSTVNITVSPTLGRAWPTFGGGPEHTGFQPVRLGAAAFVQRWQTTLANSPKPPAVADGKVYIGLPGTTSSLVALDSATGGELWRSTFPASTSVNPATWSDGRVFMQNGNHSASRFFGFNATTGATQWNSPYSAQWGSYLAPTADATGVFINGGYYGGIYGFNPVSGAQLFFQGLEQYDQWTPTLHNGGLYSFVTGAFRSHDKTTGATLWSLNFGWDWNGYSLNRTTACADNRAFLVNNSVTVPAGDQELICVDLVGRAVAWRVRDKFIGTPAVAHQAVFAISGASFNTIKSYDATTGAFLGVFTLPGTDANLTTQPIVTNDTVIASSASKTYIFDLASRALRQTIPYGGSISLAGESLYIAPSSGIVRAFSVPDTMNRPPSALAQTVTTPEDTAVTFTLQGTDADNDTLNFVIASLPSLGALHQTADGVTPGAAITATPALVTNPGGKVVLVPAADRHGSPLTSFQFAASDGKATSATVAATVHVLPVNDAPLARADFRMATPGQILSPVRELLNDFDVDGDTLTVTSFTQPAAGVVERNSDGTLRYQTPGDITSGAQQFSYTVTDAAGATATATVTVTIAPAIVGAWPTFGNGPAHTGYSSAALGRTGWAQRWSHTTGATNNSLQPVASADGRVFVSFRASDSRLTALDAGSGSVLWSCPLAAAYSMNPPSHHDGRVYVQRGNHGSDTQLIAVKGRHRRPRLVRAACRAVGVLHGSGSQ